MNRLRSTIAVLVAATLTTGLLGAAAPASAVTSGTVVLAAPPYPTEDDIASESLAPPSDAICVQGIAGSKGCFKKYGDVWYIYRDFEESYIYWENELWNGYSWRAYRSGRCNNQAGGWATCNKDYYENSSTNYFGARGSRLRWQTCIRYPGPWPDVCSPSDITNATWHRNNA